MPAVTASQEHLAGPAPEQGRIALGGLQAVGLGLLLTVLQVLVACLLSGRDNLHDAYLSLCQWDTYWYSTIVEGGYNAVPNVRGEANVGFFPGYPCLTRQLRTLTGLPTADALLLTAQLSCWAFWSYLLLLLSSWGVSRRMALAAVLSVLAYPAAFFLVAGYSESLFLACALGFLYWSEREGPFAAGLAAVHGFGMTATRLVGLPLAVYPVAKILLGAAPGSGPPLRDRLARCTVPLLIGLATAGGGLSFFLFCQARFGCWNLYMQTQHMGWGVTPDYLALFSRRALRLYPVYSRTAGLHSDFISRLSVWVFLAAFALLTGMECWLRQQQGPIGCRRRACLYFCAWLLFYIALTGMASRAMGSMIRHSLCVQVLLVLALGQLLTRARPKSAPGRLGRLLPVFCVPLFLVCELFLLHRFTHGEWVA
ncbi:MAG TPA: hypothetical protein VMG10_02035 [Gemmataceae bacterium]|nr:hypothetical protein [Gemmataceae bacterium]